MSFSYLRVQWQVVVAGGYGTDEAALSSADIYDPATDTWRALPSLSVRDWGVDGLGFRIVEWGVRVVSQSKG